VLVPVHRTQAVKTNERMTTERFVMGTSPFFLSDNLSKKRDLPKKDAKGFEQHRRGVSDYLSYAVIDIHSIMPARSLQEGCPGYHVYS